MRSEEYRKSWIALAFMCSRNMQRDFDAQSRMFAPAYGIMEESATGMAAGHLAGYLNKYGQNKKLTYIIRQGNYMNPPSPCRITSHIDETSGNILA